MIYGEMSKIIHFIILIPTPEFPYFYYMLGGNLGSLLYGDVSLMIVDECISGTPIGKWNLTLPNVTP